MCELADDIRKRAGTSLDNILERARAEARLEEAEYWHFQEWNKAAHNGKTCEEIATDWRGYVHTLYEGCMRITKLRAALDGRNERG